MSPDDLLTDREAEQVIGIPYGLLLRWRRYLMSDDGTGYSFPQVRKACPPWTKVGRSFFWKRSDLTPYITNRGGNNRNGTCGVCVYFVHDDWYKTQEWFDPNKAHCRWAETNLLAPEAAPRWLRGALRPQVEAKGGRTCDAFTAREPSPDPTPA
jgi:hypothetical protein